MNPNANVFWIEAGAMGTGGSNNLLELPLDLAEFFGQAALAAGQVSLQLPNGLPDDHDFVLRGQEFDHHVPRRRVSLPTAAQGGPDYRYRVVRFDRLNVGGQTVFEITVTDVGSTTHQAWQAQSVPPNGGMDQTGGGRSYGWWS